MGGFYTKPPDFGRVLDGMATVRIEDRMVCVDLKGADVLWACHGSFRIPLEHVKGAGTTKPPSFWESLKLIGTGAGRIKMAGTFLYHGEVVFFDYAGDENVLVIDLGENNYKHLFVHVDAPDTPEAAAARIQDQLAAAS
jgi:hypothetical protein